MTRFRRLSSHSAVLFILGTSIASCKGTTGPPSPSFALSSTALTFSGESEHPVTVTNLEDKPIEWRIQSSTASWLDASPKVGTVGPRGSATLTVQVNRAAVAEGAHSATLQIAAEGYVLPLNVSVQGWDPAEATIQPGTLALGSLDVSGVVEVVNQGGSTLNWTLASPASWAMLDPSSGRLAPGDRAQVVVTANRSGLTQGTYNAMLYLSSEAGPRTAAITVDVGQDVGLHLDPASIDFGLSTSRLPLRIVNDGYENLTWHAQPGASWITLSPSAGMVLPGSSLVTNVDVSRAGLSHGLHQAALKISSNGGSAAATIKLFAAPSGSTPNPPLSGISLSPNLLDFGQAVSQLSLVILNNGNEPLDWTGQSVASWATLSPASGRVSPHTSATVAVSVSRSGLQVGAYQTTLQFQSNGGTATSSIVMEVPASDGPSPAPAPKPAPGPSPAPAPEPAPNPDPTPAPAPEPAPDPDPTPNPPMDPSLTQIAVAPIPLDFGATKSQLSLLIVNQGASTLNWSAQSSASWLTLSSTSGSRPVGPDATVITVYASRSVLSTPGGYEASIKITSNGGNVTVPVSLLVPSPTSAPPPGGWNLSNIDASGATDVTDALNAYLASVPNGSVVSLPAGARYRVEGVVRILERSNFTIEGNGARIFATTDGSGVVPPADIRHLWPRQRSHVEIRDGSNIVIRNLSVRGANPNAGSAKGAYVADLEGQHGFDVRGTKGITLENVTVTDTYGDLLYLGPGASGWGRDAVVRNSHFERSGRQGIAITGFEDVLVEGSYIGEVGRTIIDIEPFAESGGARRVTFRNNTFGHCRHLWVHSGGRGPNVEDILFEDNQLVGMAIKVVVHTSDASPVGTRRGRHAFVRNISNMTTGVPNLPFGSPLSMVSKS